MFELILSEQRSLALRGFASNCILAIVSKRMDPQVQVGRVCGLVFDKEDSEFTLKLSALITGFAEEVLDCARKLDSNECTTKMFDY